METCSSTVRPWRSSYPVSGDDCCSCILQTKWTKLIMWCWKYLADLVYFYCSFSFLYPQSSCYLVISYAEKAENRALCVTAARHYWNTCLQLIQIPEERWQLQKPLEKILVALVRTSTKNENVCSLFRFSRTFTSVSMISGSFFLLGYFFFWRSECSFWDFLTYLHIILFHNNYRLKISFTYQYLCAGNASVLLYDPCPSKHVQRMNLCWYVH